MHTGISGHTLADVFDKSVELISNDLPHVILFDAYNVTGSKSIIFPTHYSIVVGYNKEDGKKELIINPGWGYPFQLIDLADTKIKPVRIIWAKITSTADGDKDGHTIGPKGSELCSTASFMHYENVGGSLLMKPTIMKYDGGCTTWRTATRTKHPIAKDGEPHISVAKWE